jgi:peptide/nickel transport system substrate-binding protein
MRSLRRRVTAVAGVLLSATMLGAALQGAPASATTRTSRSPSATREAKLSAAAMPSYALPVGQFFTWILPIDNLVASENWDINIEGNMWLPLYWAGNGSQPGMNYTQSIGEPPVYSNHDKTVTIKMKTNFKWSTGAPVTSKDVKFYFQLLEAGKKTVGEYVPGLLPTNISSITYPNSSTVVMHLKRSYNPASFTGDQLGWIYPLPVQEWDRTSLTSPAGSAATSPAGAKKVFTFLFSQCKNRQTYPTNPLWKVVDGPFEIDTYNPVTHDATFKTNRHYSGPNKPRIAGYKVFSFTTGTAELDALRSGLLTFGYIPLGETKEAPYFKSHGYTIKPWRIFANAVVELGFTSKTWGPLVKQLYIRQALQHLITEGRFIKLAYGGYGIPDYGPIADYPGSKYVSPQLRRDPYPYSPQAAAKLLKEHGWVKGPGGIDVCKRPGTSASECGAGIPKGKRLSFKYLYSTGTTPFFAALSSYRTVAKTVGIGLTLDGLSATTLFSIGGVCPKGPCDWGMIGYSGYMWAFGQYQQLPIGTAQWGKGNYWGGGYYTAKAQKLITAAVTKPGLKPIYAVENYLSKNLASLWWPLQDNEVAAVKKSLGGWEPLSPYVDFVQPQNWYVK